MYCTTCGKPMAEMQKFCPSCGVAAHGPGRAAATPVYAATGDEEIAILSRMNDLQCSIYNARRKDPMVALLLCLFLGGLGAHHFYLGKIAAGVLSIVFCWTLIPAIIAFVELFFIMERTRRYNLVLAQQILASGTAAPMYA